MTHTVGEYIKGVLYDTELLRGRYAFHEGGLDREDGSVNGKLIFAFCYKTTYEVESYNCA